MSWISYFNWAILDTSCRNRLPEEPKMDPMSHPMTFLMTNPNTYLITVPRTNPMSDLMTDPIIVPMTEKKIMSGQYDRSRAIIGKLLKMFWANFHETN